MSGTLPLPPGLPPLLQAEPLSLISWVVVPGRLSLVGAKTGEFSLATFPVENAVELVTILKVEPGGNVVLMALLIRGCAGSARSRWSFLISFLPSSVASRFGSKVG